MPRLTCVKPIIIWHDSACPLTRIALELRQPHLPIFPSRLMKFSAVATQARCLANADECPVVAWEEWMEPLSMSLDARAHCRHGKGRSSANLSTTRLRLATSVIAVQYFSLFVHQCCITTRVCVFIGLSQTQIWNATIASVFISLSQI